MKKQIKKILAILMVITVIASNTYLFASASEVRYSSWGSWSDWSETKQTATTTKDVQTKTETYYYHYCRSMNSGPYETSSTPTRHVLPSGTTVAFVGYLDGVEMYLSHCRALDNKGSAITGTYNGYNVSGLTSTYMCDNTCYLWHPATRTLYRYRTRTATTYYFVTYNANGGSGAPEKQEKANGKTLTLSSTIPKKSATITYDANGGSVSSTSKSVSFTFSKWNTASDGSGTSYSKGANYTKNADATLYAQWTSPTYGTLPTPTRSGYQFAGWYTSKTGGTKVTSTSTVSKSITIYAHWNKEYSVKYNANGGTGAPSAQTKVEGTNLTLSSTKPTKEGYTFSKWNTKSDGSGTSYNAGATYSDNAAATLYAQWNVNQYTVTYKVDGNTYKSVSYDYGSNIVAPANPTKTGYNFVKWAALPDTMPAKNLTVNAEFTPDYNITLGDNNNPVSIIVGRTKKVNIVIDPSLDNGVSIDWKSDNPNIVTVDNEGYATGVSCGKANIIVTTEDGVSTTIEVNVLHNYVSTVVSPTCTEQGYTQITCSSCNHTEYTNIVDRLGHSFTNYIYNNDGTKTAICDRIGCDETNTIGIPHVHTYSSVVTREATCTRTGIRTYTCTRNYDNGKKCNDSYTEIIPLIDHTYSSSVTKEPTCIGTGIKTYVCVCGDSYTEVIDPIGHDYDVSYKWDTTGKVCSATAVCKNNQAHIITESALITSKVSVMPTCLTNGKTLYTATFANSVFGNQSRLVSDIPGTGHEYEIVYTWSADGKSCSANAVCLNDKSHVLAENATVTTKVNEDATCEQGGSTAYVATFKNGNFEDQTYVISNIPAIGHNYEIKYEWDSESEECIATAICKNDESHIISENAQIKSEITLNPTCSNDGETTYTATFSNELFDTQVVTKKDIPAINHSYTITYTWSTDCKICTATAICANDKSHNVSEDGEIKANVIKEPTCSEAGVTSYEASFENEIFEKQIKELNDIFFLNHEFVDIVIDPTCTERGSTRHTCSRCDYSYEDTFVSAKDHVIADAGNNKNPTCEKDGKESDKVCSECGSIIYVGKIIPATGHIDKDNDGLCDNCKKELECVDNNGDGLCDNCKKELNHVDNNKDGLCDNCKKELECFDNNGDGLCDNCGKELNHVDKNRNCVCDNCKIEFKCEDKDGDGLCDNCKKLINEKKLLDSVKIYVPKSASIAWKTHVAFKVAARGVPKGYSMMVYLGKNTWEAKPDKDGNCYFETDIGNITTTGRVSVRIVKDGIPKANSNGPLEKDFVMTVKNTFGDKLSATFKYVINFFRRPYVILTY